jgi:spore coat protein U-like protein
VRVNLIIRSALVLFTSLFCSFVNAQTSCGIIPSGGLAFGNVVPGVINTAEGEIRIQCKVVGGVAPAGNQISVAIRFSQGNSASYAPRKLTNAAGSTEEFKLDYNVFTQFSGGPVWGDGTGSTVEASVLVAGLFVGGNEVEVRRSVYGRMPLLAYPKRAGQYTDNLIITFNY